MGDNEQTKLGYVYVIYGGNKLHCVEEAKVFLSPLSDT